MAAKPKKGEIGEDMVVLYEDQQKINLFAKKNSQLNDIKEQIAEKERIYRNVEDACDELVVADDDQLIPYEIGEIFVLVTVEEAQQRLEDYKVDLQKELDNLKVQAGEIDDILKKVKSQLYAKFGNNINLEAPET